MCGGKCRGSELDSTPHAHSQPPCCCPWAASFSPGKAHRLTDQDDEDQQTKVDMDFIPFRLSRGEARPPKGGGAEREG